METVRQPAAAAGAWPCWTGTWRSREWAQRGCFPGGWYFCSLLVPHLYIWAPLPVTDEPGDLLYLLQQRGDGYVPLHPDLSCFPDQAITFCQGRADVVQLTAILNRQARRPPSSRDQEPRPLPDWERGHCQSSPSSKGWGPGYPL